MFTGEKQIEIQEYPIPEVSDDMVLVKTDACAICTWEQRVYTGEKKVDFPFIGGHEMVGKIVKMGKNVDQRQWSVGDFVAVGVTLPCKNCYQCKSGNEQNCEHFDHSKQLEGLPEKGMGGLSSHLLVHPSNLFHLHDITPEEATITEPLSCVLHSVETADIQFGDTVVVIGCGIMGLLHTILATKRGASVIVSDTNEERTKLGLELGANNGRLVLYSSFYPDTPISISPDWLHKSGAKLMGTANSNTVDFTKATRLLSEGVVDVKPFVSEVYDLSDYQKAFESAIKGDKFRVVLKF